MEQQSSTLHFLLISCRPRNAATDAHIYISIFATVQVTLCRRQQQSASSASLPCFSVSHWCELVLHCSLACVQFPHTLFKELSAVCRAGEAPHQDATCIFLLLK